MIFDRDGTYPHLPRSGPLMAAEPGRARRVGLPRRNNSTGRCGGTLYFRAELFIPATGRPSPTSTAFR
ncbi:MAG: hypothetical protein ACE5MG_07745, partial [Candidatus Methylomirabilales bacterium]